MRRDRWWWWDGFRESAAGQVTDAPRSPGRRIGTLPEMDPLIDWAVGVAVSEKKE
jgi:hypothetical protein